MYTVEIYRKDARKKSGERLIEKRDLTVTTVEAANRYANKVLGPKDRHEVHQTMVVKKSIMPPYAEFEERYDTPYYCSPSSETYWSM
jgi:hypothetical protein